MLKRANAPFALNVRVPDSSSVKVYLIGNAETLGEGILDGVLDGVLDGDLDGVLDWDLDGVSEKPGSGRLDLSGFLDVSGSESDLP